MEFKKNLKKTLFHFSLLPLLSFTLVSCEPLFGTNTTKNNIVENPRCITDRFPEANIDNLYGIECIQEKNLFIQTENLQDLDISRKRIKQIATSHAINEKGGIGLRLEGDIDSINTVYELDYKIIPNEGDANKQAFLLNLLPENQRFLGSSNTKYQIIFKTVGNYLILFKASADINKIPYIERTSMEKNKGLYMVPFLGYPIKYCNPTPILNIQGERTYENRCKDATPEKAKYIEIYNRNDSKLYTYHEPKKDLFPSKYFEGKWFFSQGLIETPTYEGHTAPADAFFVEIQKTSENLEIVDVSGNVGETIRTTKEEIPVKWVEYQMDKEGDNFESFGETVNNNRTATERNYLLIDFPNMNFDFKIGSLGIGTVPWEITGKKGSLIDVLITENYFSFIFEIQIPELPAVFTGTSQKEELQKFAGKSVKLKSSFLREKAVDTIGFKPKRWFKDFHDQIFGVLFIAPQKPDDTENQQKDQQYAHYRMIHFNTHLNTQKEKNTNTKTIKWHFSKNSTSDSFYRDIAREAVQIWNKAFEIITQDSEKKIKIILAENEEDKDLGDLRYNIINLILTKDSLTSTSGIVGWAPSYAHSNTGQIIGTTANIFIQNTLSTYYKIVKNYIRYEIFRSNDKQSKNFLKNSHTVNSYLKAKIKNLCPDIQNFVQNKLQSSIKLRPRDNLKNEELIINCRKKLAKDYLLETLLHEMGHSFGLGHNFKASADTENYYQSVEEIKKYFPNITIPTNSVTKSSSVMDYLPEGTSPMKYLGKYDLAALRFLYRNQIEDVNGGLQELKVLEDPSQQPPISKTILNKRKLYSHCSDFIIFEKQAEDLLCERWDYGSNPYEITNYYIEKVKNILNYSRYRYDDHELLANRLMFIYLIRIKDFYDKWIQIRDMYLSSNMSFKQTKHYNILDHQSVIDGYTQAINPKNLTTDKKEYNHYYSLREKISDFFLDFFFQKTMRCEVKDLTKNGNVYSLNLEFIKLMLQSQHINNLYVEDCYSDQVLEFFMQNNIQLLSQSGFENFFSYYPDGMNIEFDVWSFSNIINQPILSQNLYQWTSVLTSEPDIFEKFRVELTNNLLNEKFTSGNLVFDFSKTLYLYQVFLDHLVRDSKNSFLFNKHFVLEENKNYFSAVKYLKGTGSSSFHDRVLDHLSLDTTDINNINYIGVPFLNTAYQKYKEYLQINKDTDIKQYIESEGLKFNVYLMNFEKFLINMKETIDNEDNSFIIPFQKDNFVEDIIKKYNSNIEILRNMHNQDIPDAIKQINTRNIVDHNEYLKQIVTSLLKKN